MRRALEISLLLKDTDEKQKIWYNIKENTIMDKLQQGCINIWIDDIVPCLKDNETGLLKETVVFKIESRSYLKHFQEKNGWRIDWHRIPKDVNVFALALKENNSIQGLVGIKNDTASQATYMHWACAAPHNNLHDFNNQTYTGVGGHLFAIAVDKSIEWGYGGVVHGFAANQKLLQHYIEKFNAEYLGMLHQYQFFIDEENAKKLVEVYTYEWNET